MALGINQTRMLIMLASPTTALVTPDAVSRSLIKRGLVSDESGLIRITPAGLRALADEMDAGRVETAIEAMERDAKGEGNERI